MNLEKSNQRQYRRAWPYTQGRRLWRNGVPASATSIRQQKQDFLLLHTHQPFS